MAASFGPKASMVASGKRSEGALTVIDAIGRCSLSIIAAPTARAPGLSWPELTLQPLL